MKKKTNPKFQLYLSLLMLLVSIFMVVSYNIKIKNNEAGNLTVIAFYAWIILLLIWLIKLIYDLKRVKKLKKIKTGKQQ